MSNLKIWHFIFFEVPQTNIFIRYSSKNIFWPTNTSDNVTIISIINKGFCCSSQSF